MIILNFSHPLSAEQIEQTRVLAGQPVEQVIDQPVQFDVLRPFEPQLAELFARAPLARLDLESRPLLVVLPALNFIAALVLAELHGRSGHFPAILRLRPQPGSNPVGYEAAEILNLQALRDAARARRFSGGAQ